MRSGSLVQLAALRNRDLELQTTSPFSNHGSVERSTACCIHTLLQLLLRFSNVPVFLCHLVLAIQFFTSFVSWLPPTHSVRQRQAASHQTCSDGVTTTLSQTSELVGGQRSKPRPFRFTSCENRPVGTCWVGFGATPDGTEYLTCPPGFDPRTSQPVAISYTK
jgi:hypothetical protein